MPSRLTLVPGSQGPRHSGSVAEATSAVLTARDRVRTMICSQGDETSPLEAGVRRCRGGGAGVAAGDSTWWGGEGEKTLTAELAIPELKPKHQKPDWDRREGWTEGGKDGWMDG